MQKSLEQLIIYPNGFIFDQNTGDSFTLNEVGVEIIKGLQQNWSQEKIKKNLLSTYETSSKKIDRDLRDFMHQLKLLHLV